MNTTQNETSKVITVDLGEVCGIAAGSRSYMMAGQLSRYRLREETLTARLIRILNEIQAPLGATKIFYTVPKRARTLRGERLVKFDLIKSLVKWAEERGLVCTPIAEPNLKKRFTGNGNASSELVIAEAERRGFRPAGKAEAFAIALFHLAFAGQEVDGDFLSALAEAL